MDPETRRSTAHLKSDLKRIRLSPHEQFSIADPTDIYTWPIIIIGPQNTPFENGIYKAVLKFPRNYPEGPPEFIFQTEMFHPNIGKDGKVCISILHYGDDFTGYEESSIRWSPVLSPESVIISVISILDKPNTDSSANLDATLVYNSNLAEYNRIVRRLAQKSLE